MIGKRIGDFEIIEEIGKGGMGRVYRAIQKSLNREVAIKVLSAGLSSNEEFVERFDLEAKSVAKLIQTNIIQMYSKGVTEDGVHYFAMEYVHGEDLSSKIKHGEKFSEKGAIDIIMQACLGLEEAQKFGIIHRDIKPSNILITNEGVVKVADFGLAKSLEATMKLTRTDVFMGTVNYTSPEQGMGKPLDHRTDIYSLGIVFYQMLTNKVPFDAETAAAIIYKHVHEKPERPRKINPNISPQAEAAVLKAIAKKPEDRYQNMKEFRVALEALLGGKSPKTPKKKIGVSYIIIAVPAILLIGGAVFYFSTTSSTESQQVEILKGLITDVTDVDKSEKIKKMYQKLQEKHPDNISLNLMKEKIDRMSEMLAISHGISENIKSLKCSGDLRNKKEDILVFARKYPEFEKNYVALNDFWGRKIEEMEKGKERDFENAKNSIIQVKTSEEIIAVRDVFVNHVCSDYREFWSRELEKTGQKKLEELIYREILVMLSTAKSLEDVEKAGNKYKKLQIGEEYVKNLTAAVEEKITDIMRKRIDNAKGLCDLNDIVSESAGYMQKYPALVKQIDTQRMEFERENQSDLKTAMADIDEKWNMEEIHDLASRFKENHPCSNYIGELEKYATARNEKINKIKVECDSMLNGLREAQDSKALDSMKDRIDKFAQENKDSTYTAKLRDSWKEKQNRNDEEDTFEYAKGAIESTKDPARAYEIYEDFKGNYPESVHVASLEDMAKLKVSVLNLKNAGTGEEVNKILNEFLGRLRSEEYKNILKAEADKRIDAIQVSRIEGIGKKIVEAKDLCELNHIEESVRRDYSGSAYVSSFTKQIRNKREAFERQDQSDLKIATAAIDSKWNMDEIREFASQFREKHLCSNVLEELDKHATTRFEKIKKIKAEHDSILNGLSEVQDVKVLESKKDSIDKFALKNKDYPYVAKLSDEFQKKRNELSLKEPAKLEKEATASHEPTVGSVFKDQSTGIEFVYIPGGTFSMGDLFGEGDGDEKHIQQVTIEGFWMSKYEVTQGQWKILMKDNPSYFKNGADYPVENVSWNDIQEFIRKINSLQHGQYSFRLPGEAEWEYACRAGGKKVRFGNGQDILDPKKSNFNGDGRYKEPYSIAGEYRKQTTPVGTFPPNNLGLHDMSGNVWEWTQDNYESHNVKLVTDNHSNDSMATCRVIRGGSWNFRPCSLRATNRDYFPQDAKLHDCGFRLALSVNRQDNSKM